MSAQDPYLSLPLNGLRLIEASAGTGKTFTLATLFTRLVVEHGLSLAHILAVTYTEAATQELRARIRDRLALAVEVLTRPDAEDGRPEVVLTRQIVDRHLARSEETAAQLHARLRRAVEDADLASIFTIHGFCARVLREYAVESGQPLVERTLVSHPRELYRELAGDLWRSYSRCPDDAQLLAGLWKDPAALASDLDLLSSDLPLSPALPETMPANPLPGLAAATRRLIQAINEHAAHAQQLIDEAFARNLFDGRRARRPSFDKALIELQAGMALGEWPRGKDQNGKDRHIDKLSPARLQAMCRPGQRAPASPLFDALGLWFDADDLRRQWCQQQTILLLHRLRADLRARLAALKQQRQLQTFDDFIQQLASALRGAHREQLCERLRGQYRFALVDEFQDTDPRQWEIFHTLFRAGLFLIGDPKQAIYGFRGGDIHTYLAAKAQAREAPPLNHNFRSRPCVLRALAALYQQAGSAAFGGAGIAFIPVLPGGQARDDDYLLDHAPAPGLTLCRVESPANVDPARAAITAACAADIHRILRAARDGRASIKGQPVEAADIAVLVRSHKEASLIRKALAQLGIPAVSAGRQSLYASAEALDIRLLLMALMQPSDPGRLRAALSTVLLGEDAAAIAALDQVPQHTHFEAFSSWRQLYQRSGIFALLSTLCARHAARILQLDDGERRLTNILQLAELLQEASRQHPGLAALLGWLDTRIANADDQDDAQQLRLESDARCVQIVTLHKSKGLEYPLVYLPFVGLDRPPSPTARHCIVHAGQGRCLHWKMDRDADGWLQAWQQAGQEDRNEAARVLYVGMTRARHALWIAEGEWKGHDASPLAVMLQDRAALAASPEIALTTASADAPIPPRLPPAASPVLPPPRRRQRRIHADWWVYSFTQLAHAEGQRDRVPLDVDGGAEDERIDL